MDEIVRKFESRYGGVWTKVKFYIDLPKEIDYKEVGDIRFCKAVTKARITPVLLSKSSISCPGARYVFGWDPEAKKQIIDACQQKRQLSQDIVESILDNTPRLNEPFNYIGLNTADKPDLVISYLQPEQFMGLLKVYHDYRGENLEVSLSSIMSVCGNIAVNAYLNQRVCISFGCDDAREYGSIPRDRLAVGVPNSLFGIFI